MGHFLDIVGTGLAAVLLHPLRSLVSVIALVTVLLPYLTGLGLSRGLQEQAEASAVFGADLYIKGSQFGRPVPVPVEAAARIRKLDGVTEVIPRIIGEVVLGKDNVHAVLVGVPDKGFPAWSACVEGALPRPGQSNELVIGTALARALTLKVGSPLLPFYQNDKEGDRLSRVVGVFKADAPLWQANLILTSLETAKTIFSQPDLVTDLLVWCRPGYQAAVSRIIEHDLSFAAGPNASTIKLRVTAREDLLALLPRGLLHREGLFNLHFLLAFVVGILVLLVTSGIGLSERRREIGILKASGWQTDEVLLRGVVESFVLSLIAACLASLLAWVWLRVFNGFGVAGLFLAGIDTSPALAVPFRLTPVPVLLAFVFSFVIVATGTVYSTWRAATAAPRDAMR
jgi:ABC-type lipoprotein release transport system permease subunit